MMFENTESQKSADILNAICLICQSKINSDDSKARCPLCQNEYHKECWEENNGCATYGCPNVPPTEPLKGIEIPVSYWGKEKKRCPSCENEILSAALRCSHCGAIFSSQKPLSREEFQEEETIKGNEKTLRRSSILFFLLSVFTLTAPFGAVIGFFWYRSNKKALASISHTHTVLTKVGIAVGIVQTLLLVFLIGIIQILSYFSPKGGL